jgi:hypothetical protein
VLAANEWFNNKNGVKKGGLIQNQGGGSIRGPIFKNKLFAYGYYELFRRKQQTPQNHTVLTSTARQGVFIWTPPGSTTPQQVNLFGSGGLRPSLAIDPFVASLLTQMPTTINNFSVGDSKSASKLFNSAGFSFNKRQNRTRDNYGVRLDWNASEHHSFAGTWAWNRDVLDRPDIDTSFNLVPVVSNDESVKFLSTAWRWSPKTTFTNEVRFGFNLAPAIFNTAQDFSKGFVLSGLLYTNPDTTFRAQGRNTNTYSWQDNGSYLRGNHSFKFGGLVQRIHVRPFNDAGTIEQLNLGISTANTSGLQSSDFTSRGGISAADLATANNLLVSLVGFVSSIQQGFNVTSRTSGFVPGATNTRNLTLNDWSLYAGDSWRLRKNLTLELGLRWEYVGRFDEQDGLVLVPVIPAGQTALQTLLSNATVDFAGGDTGRSIYNKDLNNFAPQIGIAWDPQGNGKMAIRAGYSVHFVNDETIRAANNATSAIQGLSSTNSVLNLTNTISSSLPLIPTPTFKVPLTFRDNRLNLGVVNSTGFMVDPNIKTPYVQEWNLSIQREIGWKTSLSVAYVGNKGTKLYRGLDYNQVLIIPNGFLADFLRARSNFFLTGNPGCTPAQNPGCQTLIVFPNLASGGLLNNATIRGLIQRGEAGELAATYYTNNLAGTVQFTPNQNVFVADLLQNFSNSNYHSGVVEVRRRFGRSLYFQTNYVFSKVLTDYAAPTNNDQARFSPLLDNTQPGLEKSRAEFDLSHAFKGNFVYELPVGKGHRLAPSNSALSRIMSGWSLTSVFTWQSGPPFSILSNRGTLNRAARSTGKNTAVSTFSSQQVSNLAGVFFQSGQVFAMNPTFIGPDGRGVPADAVTCKPLVTGGFCNPDPGTVGALSRLAFGGPTFFNWDFSVIKQTPIMESKKLEYRAEFFNVLNHPTFFVGDQNVNGTTFGVISSTSSTARLVQMSLRFIF